MALIGLGIGPALSGLQIAMQRTVAPAAIGAAMGTLLLLRQVGGVGRAGRARDRLRRRARRREQRGGGHRHRGLRHRPRRRGRRRRGAGQPAARRDPDRAGAGSGLADAQRPGRELRLPVARAVDRAHEDRVAPARQLARQAQRPRRLPLRAQEQPLGAPAAPWSRRPFAATKRQRRPGLARDRDLDAGEPGAAGVARPAAQPQLALLGARLGQRRLRPGRVGAAWPAGRSAPPDGRGGGRGGAGAPRRA